MYIRLKEVYNYIIELTKEEKIGLCDEIIGLPAEQYPLLKRLQNILLMNKDYRE